MPPLVHLGSLVVGKAEAGYAQGKRGAVVQWDMAFSHLLGVSRLPPAWNPTFSRIGVVIITCSSHTHTSFMTRHFL